MENESTGKIIVPKKPKIMVMGIGGGGGNSVNSMVEYGIKTAEFVCINTDAQSLEISKAPKKINIGTQTTKGLGAGSDPVIGRQAAEESRDEIRNYLNDVDLLFITAGMGGGTGTGAAPVVASIAKEKNILTIAIVTKPFEFEGYVRQTNAEEGIKKLSSFVDALIVIPNDNIIKCLGDDATMTNSFKFADSMLRDAIRGLADCIAIPNIINLDFKDVQKIMKNQGMAHLAIGEAEGQNKIERAIEKAIMSDLLGTNISGASGVIVNIIGGTDLKLNDVAASLSIVRKVAREKANIIFGTGIDESYGDKVQVTIIATGFEDMQQRRTVYGKQNVEHSQITNDQMQDLIRRNLGANGTTAYNRNTYGGYSSNQQPIQPVVEPVPQENNNVNSNGQLLGNQFGGGYSQPQVPNNNRYNPVPPQTNGSGPSIPPWNNKMKNR